MQDSPSGPRRRDFLLLGTLPLFAATGLAACQKTKIKTSAHIVIAGSGLGGIAVASRLCAMLDGARITMLDRKEEHNYQPGYTLVATGIWPVSKVRDHNADFHLLVLNGCMKWRRALSLMPIPSLPRPVGAFLTIFWSSLPDFLSITRRSMAWMCWRLARTGWLACTTAPMRPWRPGRRCSNSAKRAARPS